MGAFSFRCRCKGCGSGEAGRSVGFGRTTSSGLCSEFGAYCPHRGTILEGQIRPIVERVDWATNTVLKNLNCHLLAPYECNSRLQARPC